MDHNRQSIHNRTLEQANAVEGIINRDTWGEIGAIIKFARRQYRKFGQRAERRLEHAIEAVNQAMPLLMAIVLIAAVTLFLRYAIALHEVIETTGR